MTNLYRITLKDAEHLMMAPSVAGGFCAVAVAVRNVVEHVASQELARAGQSSWSVADVLAYLPEGMFGAYKTRMVSIELAEAIMRDLEREADMQSTYGYDDEAEACRHIAGRVRALLA